uniref:HDC07194 n=1 Tax=Drosophila melanogaster TaxID=7227 RepID=Q6IG53_DROME|nr:TPA_inf: HDC07194 [Drosophila melanogaster]
MVSFGGVAKLLSSFECCASSWVKAVNPGWYEAREIPKTILIQKVRQVPQNTRCWLISAFFHRVVSQSSSISSFCLLRYTATLSRCRVFASRAGGVVQSESP